MGVPSSVVPPVQHRLLAILAADAVGYSRQMQADDTGTLATLEEARRIFRAAADEHGGKVVDTAGDSVLAAFDTATGAVNAADRIQERLAELNAPRPDDRRMPFRIGVHLGDVIVQPDGTLYGDGVNVAARLQALAQPGFICVSDAVRAAVRPEISARMEDLGEHTLKNIERPVRVFRISPNAPSFDVSKAVEGFGGRPAIAVLPFDNMSTDAEQQHLADGIAEDILTRLAMLRWIPVIARNSSFVYRGRSVDIKQVGKELGARYVLEGSVRRAGNRVRITGQLIDAATGHHVWADRYDRLLDDFFALQDEIVEAIVNALEPAVGEAERTRAEHMGTQDMGAWELHQKALIELQRLDKDSFMRGIELALKAAEKDTSFAWPLATAGVTTFFTAMFGWRDPAAALADAHRYGSEGLRRDPQNPWCMATMAAMAVFGHKYDVGRELGAKALRIHPSYAHGHYFAGFSAMVDGDAAAAMQSISTALRLSPHDMLAPMMFATLSGAHYMAGDFARAREVALLGIELAPHYPMGHRSRANACGALGLIDEGQAALARYLQMVPNYSSEYARRTVPFRHDKDFERYMDGLRKLGFER